MRISERLAFPTEANERRSERQSVKAAGRVRELGGPGIVGQVREVSVGGCRLSNVSLPDNAEIWVTVGVAAPRRARVVWLKAGEAGCQFYTPLSRAELRNIVLGRG